MWFLMDETVRSGQGFVETILCHPTIHADIKRRAIEAERARVRRIIEDVCDTSRNWICSHGKRVLLAALDEGANDA